MLPTPVFWPGEFHRLYSPWGCKELDTAERLSCHTMYSHTSLSEGTFSASILSLIHLFRLKVCVGGVFLSL